MFNSSILEVAIGLVFIYLLLSLICTSIQEAISSVLNQRGKNLFGGIKNLLNDPGFTGLAQHVYNHGLVSGSTQYAAVRGKPDREPSYLAPNTFALALMDILGSLGAVTVQFEAAAKGNQTAQASLHEAQAKLESANHLSVDDPNDPLLEQARGAAQNAVEKAQIETARSDATLQTVTALQNLQQSATAAAGKVKKFCDWANRQDAALALQKMLAAGRTLDATAEEAWASCKSGVLTLPAGHTQEALLVLIKQTEREAADVGQRIPVLQANIEAWFNDAMDRVGGWYKRWTQLILFFLAAAVVTTTNADTLNILRQLDRKGPETAAIVTAAENAARVGNLAGNDVEAAAHKLDLPLGWSNEADSPQGLPGTWGGFFFKVAGLVCSIFAVSLGAPFWFDTLSKFVNLRGAGNPPGESKKSAPDPARK